MAIDQEISVTSIANPPNFRGIDFLITNAEILDVPLGPLTGKFFVSDVIRLGIVHDRAGIAIILGTKGTPGFPNKAVEISSEDFSPDLPRLGNLKTKMSV